MSPPSAPAPHDLFAAPRERMIVEQLTAAGRDIRNERVLAAMAAVPRHEFIPEEGRVLAYLDRPVPIGFEQTISQPYIVALMTGQLEPQPTDRVLEIGTGCGYQSAVLSLLVAEVYSIEIIDPLSRRASETLQRLGYGNVCVRSGDGHDGWPEAAPFDSMIVTCAPDRIPASLIAQLKDGGRMTIPVGDYHAQELHLFKKRNGGLDELFAVPVSFVPMTGGALRG